MMKKRSIRKERKEDKLSMDNKKRQSHKKDYAWGYILGGIPLLGFLIFGLIPLVISLIVSFNDPFGYTFDMEFVGLNNYVFIFTDPKFYRSILNTLYALLSIPITMILAVLIATVLNNSNLKGRNVYRTIFFVPYVCSVVAVSIMWKWMLDGEYGIINQFLATFGIGKTDWLNNEATFMPVMILMSVWSSLGFQVILYSAALTNVDDQVYEAADMDGAGTIRKFLRITLPSISPTTFFILTTGLISGLQDFSRFEIMTGGGTGPNNAGLTIVYYLYRMGFKDIVTYGMGFASAVAWILTIMVVIMTAINFKFSNKWVHD